MSDPERDKASVAVPRWGCGECLFWCLVISWLWFAFSPGFHNSLSGHHSFRQTQNASAIYYYAQEKLTLYQTVPSLGPNWRIAQELPVYHWISGMIVRLFKVPIEETGRAVSIAFFAGSLIFIRNIFSVVAGTSAARCAVLLVATSPVYIYWSRSVMIESTALFFASVFAYYLLRWAMDGGIPNCILALLFGALSVTTKLPAYLGVSIAFGLGVLVVGEPGARLRCFRRLLVIGIVTTVVFLGWYAWSSAVAADVVLAEWMRGASYREWFFGHISDRFDPQKWKGIAAHVFPHLFGSPAWALVLIVALLAGCNRIRWVAALLVGFLAPILLFFNVHFVHDYYFYSSGFLLAGVLAVAINSRVAMNRWRLLAAASLVGILITNNLFGYWSLYRGLQYWNPTDLRSFARQVSAATKPDEVLILYGFSWNPEFAYYSERLAIQDVHDQPPNSDRWRRAMASLGGKRVGAIVFFGAKRDDVDFVRNVTAPLDFVIADKLSYVDYIYKRDNAIVYLPRKVVEAAQQTDQSSGSGARR